MTNEKKITGLDQEHQHTSADANNAVTYAPASEDKSDTAGTTSELQPNLRRSADTALKDGIIRNEYHPRSSILLLGLVKDLRDVIGRGKETEESGSSTGRGKGAASWLQWKRFANCTVTRMRMLVMGATRGLEFGSHMLKMALKAMIRTRRPCLRMKSEIDWNRADAARLSWKAKTKSQREVLVWQMAK